MASYAIPIANAVRTVVAALTNAPPLVEVRKMDTVHPREATTSFSACIITLGEVRLVGGQMGGGSDANLGPVQKTYEVGITIYGTNFGDISSNMDTHPEFVLRVKQALNKTALAGVPTVYDTELFEHPTWESQMFAQAGEVSRFGILYFNSEPRNG